ncbi:oxidoreductase [Haliangium sp.]|uniref:oxidoreductase n=1 Tax=Haliangium sp. TaxID=2663208 RepID=UPI003D11A260
MAHADPSLPKVVLITGCSSGIGKATALRLHRAGYLVYATARRPETLGELAEAGCRTVALDVTDEASMASAVARIEAEHGAVDVLVNNAGYSQSGALEEVAIDAVRRQFETNVFGLMRLTQLVLPGMRSRGWGKIVNLGSMGGKLTFPGGGVYHATKHALEALSDALRFEVRGFGVDVILIQPGLIRTSFSDAAVGSMAANQSSGEPYESFNLAVAKATQEAYESGLLAKLAGGPDDVARVIERALRARRPRARYTVTASAKLLLTQRKLMSDRVWDAFLRSQFPQPKQGAQSALATATAPALERGEAPTGG